MTKEFSEETIVLSGQTTVLSEKTLVRSEQTTELSKKQTYDAEEEKALKFTDEFSNKQAYDVEEEKGLKFASEHKEQEEYVKSPEERALVRKIDLMILPIICTIDFLQFLDKTTLNYAAMLGIIEDLELNFNNRFSLVSSIFYLGYLLYQQLAALRFLLGFFESGIYPALSLLVSTFYRRSEQAARLGYIWLCNGFGIMFGGLISYGIGRMEDHGVVRWRWIMFILGAVTSFVGAFAFFFLIGDTKSKLLRLTPEQETMMDERIKDNAVVPTKVIKKEHIYEALKEVRLWAFCLASMLFCFRNGGMTSYDTQVTNSFGFTKLQSILLMIPNGALDIIFILLSVQIVNRTNQTIYVACASMAAGTIGTLLMIVIPVPRLKLIGQYVALSAVPTYVLMLASLSNNVSGYTKKIFYNSMMMISYTVGNFIGPYIMSERFAPHYVPSFVIFLVANVLGIVLLLVARWRMVVANRRRLAQPPAITTKVEDDLTDAQDPNFIYRM
ncbi:hypothetical protein DFQ28_004308 [Apophysomyces sp. BC1034]|nr:hypothetical protein DFQ30_003872 [Apophysomyces sp. BC1015]KAG0178787.1 hypothetical protein DFQ29_002999 [Apophysomyces sp. BC1021]KAG0188842.1 hypothetical protein DFQ28_004308 [Apophysomyces sp. BC1034]